MWKIKLQKIVGNLLDKFRKLYMNGTVISYKNLQPSSSNRNFWAIFASLNRYFTVVGLCHGCPCYLVLISKDQRKFYFHIAISLFGLNKRSKAFWRRNNTRRPFYVKCIIAPQLSESGFLFLLGQDIFEYKKLATEKGN